jgi:chemotaxis protein MotA
MLRVLMLSFIKGNPPVMTIEVGRRAIPPHVRPTFEEVETTCRGVKPAEGTANDQTAA